MPGPLPERLGQRFELGDLIGRGTCSEVYRAHDLLLDREAAVKIFPVEDDPRIEREVALMASLDHPSLVPVYDVGSVDGRAFVVMALLEGGNLSDRLADRPLGVTETLLAVAAVADGLGHVHRAGVLHRDVTPRNVLFDADGRAHLSDFGVAFVAEAPRITDTGIVVGSAPYLAPEQVRGEEVSAPADVYALGLVMIEALTGRPAYVGRPLAAARERLERRPEMPAGIDIEVEALLEAMTADDPRARPTAEQVCVGLRRAALAAETLTPLRPVAPLAGVGPACAVPEPTTETMRSARRAPVAAGTSAAAPVGIPAPDDGEEHDETPGRARRAVAGAGGLVVAASVGAAVLLASGVVVASAWTVDRVSTAAPPAATVAPPTAEVVAEPGAAAIAGGGSGGGSGGGGSSEASDGGDDAAPAIAAPRRTSSDDAEDRPVATQRRTSTEPTDRGSEEPTSTRPTTTRTSEPTHEQAVPSASVPSVSVPSVSVPSVPLPSVSLPTVPGLPSVSLPTRSSESSSTHTSTAHSSSTPASATAVDNEDGGAPSSRTTTTTRKKPAAVDPAVEALGGLFGGDR